MLRLTPILILSLVLSAGCKKAPPPANPEFNDALHQTFVAFEAPEVEVAFAMRVLEGVIDASSMDLSAENSADRALAPEPLSEADVAEIVHPEGYDPANTLPVALGGLSAYPPADHARIQMLTDQRPVEPYSPDFYERSFEEGQECWLDAGCRVMRTWNDLIKKNALMEVPYAFNKDFRWIDMNLPDPADVPEGEEPVNPGEPRVAMLGRSWQEESAEGEGGNVWIHQSYTIEAWIPRGDGTLHVLSVWSETEFDGISFSDDMVTGTTRAGIDRNFEAAEEWLDTNPAE